MCNFDWIVVMYIFFGIPRELYYDTKLSLQFLRFKLMQGKTIKILKTRIYA